MTQKQNIKTRNKKQKVHLEQKKSASVRIIGENMHIWFFDHKDSEVIEQEASTNILT